MRIWIALLVAPVAALADQLVAMSLVSWGCAHQVTWPVHLSHAVCLAITALAAAGAWGRRRETPVPAGAGEATMQLHFLAGVAMTVAALSAVAIVAMWIPVWMVSACIA